MGIAGLKSASGVITGNIIKNNVGQNTSMQINSALEYLSFVEFCPSHCLYTNKILPSIVRTPVSGKVGGLDFDRILMPIAGCYADHEGPYTISRGSSPITFLQ